MFHPTQSDAIGTLSMVFGSVLGRVSVGQDIHFPNVVDLVHEGFEVSHDGQWGHGLFASQYFACVAVEREIVAS